MTRDAILTRAGQIIRETLRCGPIGITHETRPMDVRGWDSLSQTVILLNLEDGFDVRLPMDRVNDLRTVGDLVDLIAELEGAR